MPTIIILSLKTLKNYIISNSVKIEIADKFL